MDKRKFYELLVARATSAGAAKGAITRKLRVITKEQAIALFNILNSTEEAHVRPMLDKVYA